MPYYWPPERELAPQARDESYEAYLFREKMYWEGIDRDRQKLRTIRANVEERFGPDTPRRARARRELSF